MPPPLARRQSPAMFYERLFDCLNRHGIRYLASITDLIAMKTEAGREKDLRDIKYLTIISRREDPA